MKSERIKNASLSYICDKNWSEMKQVPGGRFCESCQHVVHDFTEKDQCELKKILAENTRVCGKFKRSQMSADFLKYAAATMIATASVTMNSCGDNEVQPADQEIESAGKAIKPNALEQPPQFGKIRFGDILFPVHTTQRDSYMVGIVAYGQEGDHQIVVEKGDAK